MKTKSFLFSLSSFFILTLCLALQGCKPNEPEPKNSNFYQLETDFMITNGGDSIQRSINDISFVDDHNGVICGVYGLLAKTTNGGRTWQLFDIGIPPDYPVRYVFMLSNNTFFLYDADLKVTNDGGINFSILQTPRDVVHGIYFFDAQRGFIQTPGPLYSTEDGGETWQQRLASTRSRDIFEFPSSTVGYLAGGNSGHASNCCGGIMKTMDGGKTWFNLPTGTAEIRSISFVDENIGYYTTVNWEYLDYATPAGTTYEVFKTIDGGATWVRKPDTPFDIDGLIFIDEQMGYAISNLGAHKIMLTEDGAETWEKIYEVKQKNEIGVPCNLHEIIQTPNHIYVIGGCGIVLKKDL